MKRCDRIRYDKECSIFGMTGKHDKTTNSNTNSVLFSTHLLT